MKRLGSVQNEQVKEAAKLLQGKYRGERGVFLLHGEKLVEEALEAGYAIETLFFQEEKGEAAMAALCHRFPQAVEECVAVPISILEKLSDLASAPPLIAVAKQKEAQTATLQKDCQYLLLENVQDPSNVGTILRTAEAFGLGGVLQVGSWVDCTSPKVLRGSMGSSLRLPLFSYETPKEAAEAMEAVGLHLFGAALDKTARTLEEMQFPKGSVVAVGNEGRGLTTELLALCRGKLYIEMQGQTNSLSAPIAAGIILYKLTRA